MRQSRRKAVKTDMGLMRYLILVFALGFLTVALLSLFTLAMQDRPTDEFYSWSNQSINKTTAVVEPILSHSADYSSTGFLVAAVILFGAAGVFMWRKAK